MRTFSLYLLCISLMLAMGGLNAQPSDSLRIKNEEVDSLLFSDDRDFDILFYKHRNNTLINNTGAFGSHSYAPTGFDLFRSRFNSDSPFSNEWLNQKEKKAFTNVKYINASRKEQLFSVLHMQNFGRFLELNFFLDRVSSPGTYANQEANNALFSSELILRSKKDRYVLKLMFDLQRDNFEENGGLANIDFYESALYDNERTYSVNLSQSERVYKRNKYALSQDLNLFKLQADSLSNSWLYLNHSIELITEQKAFYDNDPLSPIFKNIFIDSTGAVDSVYRDLFNNKVGIGIQSKSFDALIFGEYGIVNYEQRFGIDTSFSNSYLGGAFKWSNTDIKTDGVVRFGILGYRTGDIDASVKLSKNVGKDMLEATGYYHLNEPNISDVNYTSNHFRWRNYSLNKQGLIGVRLAYSIKKYRLKLNVESKMISSLIYLDTAAIVSQLDDQVQLTSASVEKKYTLWRFHFLTAGIYQLTSDETRAPIPQVILRQIAYFEKKIFKGALKVQLGAGISYTTEYFGYGYMPALGRFHEQRSTELGNYPNLDLFLNTHLKRAQIFLKYEHFNAGGNLARAIGAPGFPLLNKSLKFGVSWNMFD